MNKNKNIFENACFLKQYLFHQGKRMANDCILLLELNIYQIASAGLHLFLNKKHKTFVCKNYFPL